ncbi:carnitine O-acetyltransferase isoform X2 [Condylostylus longicornis]|nr:carnitine O-acetyltransferase isoform X2 [Condylostylus longicornis]
MQILTRKILFSLFKNPALSESLYRSIYSSSVVLNNSAANITGQKLLTYPALSLEDTLNKFIKTAQPFLTKAELDETENHIKHFQRGDGKKLQKLLEDAAGSESNWLAERWLRCAYLEYRDPVCVFSSPGMTFTPQNFKTDDDMLQFAAKAIYANLQYKKQIDDSKLPVVKMGKFELDNSQFYRIFGTCRLPQKNCDGIEFHHATSKHIIVMAKNHFFYLPVYTNNGEIIHGDYLAKALTQAWQEAAKLGNAVPIGVLTSDNRDNWASAYEKLVAIKGNHDLVKKVQSALFVVCLDDLVPVSDNNVYEVLSKQLIHGGGSSQNSGNRWFDKCIQVIINRNGVGGFCYEHSPAEGVAIAQMSDNIIDFAKSGQYEKGGVPDSSFKPERLNFQTSNELLKHVEIAKQNVTKLANDLHLKVLHYKTYGKGFMKQYKLSPDSFIQMAMQYAFYRMHNVPGGHYESAHLRIFKNGRTETIRSCSNESIDFAKEFSHGTASNDKKCELLRNAVNAHRTYTNEALAGKGVDRHLLGLKLMAREHNLPIPDFFNIEAVKRSANFRLSTSQVPSKHVSFMCYGPLVSDGYGICYNPRENDMVFAISSWESASETDSDKMAVNLSKCLDDMRDCLEKQGVPPPKSKL